MTLFIMAEEEDEIDILGDSDYNLDHLLSKDDSRLGSCYVSGVLGRQGAELLNCDYNIGSHWLLEAPNQSCWYAAVDESKAFERNQFSFTSSLGNNVADSLPSTSQWEDNDIWTDKEKSLLEQGLEIFGHSWTQLSQFIGTKTSEQVKNYVTSQNVNFSQTVENFTLDSSAHSNTEVFNFSELIDDIQIPASMEEVIAVVSTAQPTIPSLSKKKNSSVVSRDNYSGERGKRKETQERLKIRRGRPPVPRSERRDLKTSLPIKKNKLEQISSPVSRQSIVEQVVRIKKEGSLDSDEDAEIEVIDKDCTGQKVSTLTNKEEIFNVQEKLPQSSSPEKKIMEKEMRALDKSTAEHLNNNEELDDNSFQNKSIEKDNLKVYHSEDNARTVHSHQEVLDLIFNIPPPRKEIFFDSEVITEGERSVHVEFFEGRSAKTPKRYLKIRNHILECWRLSRPAYVTKTSVRTGLKHCGDVNCIGRIHAFLEQIGAINFGCEQARYLNTAAPSVPIVPVYKKLNKDELAAMQQARICAMRPRKKKSPGFTLDGDGGYTITHSESGEAIHTTVVQDTCSKGSKGLSEKAKTIKLIYCHKFSDSKPAPFIIQMKVEALLVVDLHAHSSHTEVAGLLGGTFDAGNGVLYIKRALPCRSNSSGVHCDICPVSQTEASEKLQGDGLEVVGWYHSHPTFLPNPSLQDLNTQNSIQQWFSHTAASPIVSFILAPYCSINPTLASQFRCLTVHADETETSPFGTPYMFPVLVSSHGLNVASMVKDMAAIFSLVEENQQVAVDFNSEFQMNPAVSYKQKCVESAKLHLLSSKPSIPHSLQNSVVQSIMEACNTLALARGDCNNLSDC